MGRNLASQHAAGRKTADCNMIGQNIVFCRICPQIPHSPAAIHTGILPGIWVNPIVENRGMKSPVIKIIGNRHRFVIALEDVRAACTDDQAAHRLTRMRRIDGKTRHLLPICHVKPRAVPVPQVDDLYTIPRRQLVKHLFPACKPFGFQFLKKFHCLFVRHLKSFLSLHRLYGKAVPHHR